MNIKNTTTKLAAAAILPLVISATADAQVPGLNAVPNLTYSRGTNHETWHTVLIISGILLFAGLVSDDSTLTILGGAGVLVALSETNGNAYALRPVRGFELAKSGPLSFGISPFGQMRFGQELRPSSPSFVLQAKIKF